ncbi:MAG: PhzF family phenazine biosynthesis protein [Chitinophagaceae bacterium]|nr:PhzF family phenazine biosynthesis protein [Chitinophagaceae bacterium]
MITQVQVINAFSIEGKGGNPAGVVFDADGLSTERRQQIATAAGFPETAFVSNSAIADYKLEFFTPVKQIPHCGHATIATFSYLKSAGKISTDISSKETIDGTRTILFKEGLAFMEQKAPRIEPVTNIGEVLDSLHISSADLMPGHQPAIVNTGNSFLIIPLVDQTVLSAVDYDRDAVYRISEKYGLIGYYLYTTTPGYDATTRMFAPFYGIDEEAGTGMAAGPLAVYLRHTQLPEQTDFRIQQGSFMKPASPSLIKVSLELEDGRIRRLFAGGGAHISGSVEVSIPR